MTWVRSHGSDQDFCAEFGIHNLYRKRANDAADRLCRDRAGEAVPKGHQDFVSRLDGIHQEVCDILGRRAWILLTSEDRPPLDAVTPFCKPGRQPARTSPATVLPRPPPVAKDGGPNKAEVLRQHVATGALGHDWVWSVSTGNNKESTCKKCKLGVKQVLPPWKFTRMTQHPCAGIECAPPEDWGVHPSHRLQNVSAGPVRNACRK